MSTLPAAAVPVGAVVQIDECDEPFQAAVTAVLNATPTAGRLVLVTGGSRWEMGAAEPIEIVSLPTTKHRTSTAATPPRRTR